MLTCNSCSNFHFQTRTCPPKCLKRNRDRMKTERKNKIKEKGE
jgi:hypothetical protein